MTRDSFGRCTIVLLQAFIYVREFIGIRVTINKGFEWSKGKANLVEYAYVIHMKPTILPLISEECEQVSQNSNEDPTQIVS